MSVRRLAEPSVQPPSFAFNQANAAAAEKWIAKYPKGRQHSAVIPLLMLAQEQEGWVTKAAIEHVADKLDMAYIRALEVATFYTQFQLKPVGTRAHVQVCGTTPCMLRGSEALMDVCRSKIHPEQFHTNADGTLSWEEVECLGACVNAPMIMIFKDTYEDLTPERLGEIIDAFEAGKGDSIPPGTQIDRIVSAPQSGLTSLTNEKLVLKSTRDREARAAEAAEGAATPPSEAGRPRTAAAETSAAVKSPSPEKVSAQAEKTTSVEPPNHVAANANQASEKVEKTRKQRSAQTPRSEPASAYKSPELSKVGPTGQSEEIGKAATAATAAKPSLDDANRPAGMARPEQPDDLKLISGVGPKVEGILHSLGIYTFAQVASWNRQQRDWIDSYLNFKGRIERDDWVKQADALARGGVEEYIRVFGKKPV
ncbi:NADH-quinone oxidoreductase subunit E [Mesorhizobium sp. BAC0120]|uniref:NADH-quinone oxidoreductase subunit E n=1 Tax=Mesorhizobium sp. BAC0120 TaxID=3090670 RepID=UPI00298BD2DE|nr:NADH-quinone oxidoreductase subunit E [Mesorhizobium sp. BAC0120]MDW6021467.1 NADH-quinone oxidoreductase subunit E [Mesorhizobium sp. BAC0120]